MCFFPFLKTIQECEDPFDLLRPMETQHLVLRTRLHVMEFKGIKLLLDNCPNLETLTFDIFSRSLFSVRLLYSSSKFEHNSYITMYDFPESSKFFV